MERRLGRLPKKTDDRTFQLSKYMASRVRLPRVPVSLDWSSKLSSYPMLANDVVGDCTIASAGHMIETWTEDASNVEAIITDSEVLAAYAAITGYTPDDPASDRGAAELDVLNAWRRDGIADHKITAFMEIGHVSDPAWLQRLRVSVALFGGAYLGVALPLSAQDQSTWDVPQGGTIGNGEPGGWGGHAVPLVAYRPASAALGGGIFTCVTWGQRMDVTARFLLAYCEEAYVVLSPDWFPIDADGHIACAPSGFDVTQLEEDLRAL